MNLSTYLEPMCQERERERGKKTVTRQCIEYSYIVNSNNVDRCRVCILVLITSFHTK